LHRLGACGVAADPDVPADAAGAFAQWDRAWGIAEVRLFGVVDRWWDDSTEDSSARGVRAVLERLTAPRPAVSDIVAANRRTLKEVALQRSEVTIDNDPPSWGTFAMAEPPPKGIDIGSETGYGWPRPCLWLRVLTKVNRLNISVSGGRLEGGYLISGSPEVRDHRYRALPLNPIWGGMAVNVAAFAALWWVILFLPKVIRRRVRRRRGCCVACGYDLRALPARAACPECGLG
jgi:hypothetical protein